MFFLCLLSFLVILQCYFSGKIDKSGDFRNDSFINIFVLLITTTVLHVLCLLIFLTTDNATLLGFFCKITYLLEMLFMMEISVYFIKFPSNRKNFFTVFFNILLIFGTCFLVFKYIKNVVITTDKGIVITSDYVYPGLPFTWQMVVTCLYVFLLPLLSVIVMLFKRIQKGSDTYIRKIMNIIAVFTFEVLYFLFNFAAIEKPLFTLMCPFACTALMIVTYRGSFADIVLDWKYIVQKIVEIILIYVLPGLICGIGVAFLSLYVKNVLLYIVGLAVFAVIMLALVHWMKKVVKRKMTSFTKNYEKQLEKELSSIDFSGNTDEVVGKLDLILSSNVGTKNITILMNHGRNFETVYKTPNDTSVSHDSYDGEKQTVDSHIKNLSISTDEPIFDSLLGLNKNIVFRNQLSLHIFSNIKNDMEDLFEKANSEVCILLVQGHRLLGLLFLGERKLGNAYTDYDFSVFEKLYPHFYLVGYYMHSIANQSVVGTVNREIKMSDQIIHSIQENMDFIKNPKVDVGYVMIPSHNIGGEFIDFIRLTDERHIFILGSMSGKGITASMSMVILKSIIRTFLKETKDFKELVQKVNLFIRSSLPRGTFFSGVFALIDFSQDVMYYINCGIPGLFLYTQAYNNVIEIQGEGKVLGFVQNVEKLLKVKKIKLSPGDILFACTEGLIESHSLRGEIFGKSRIQKSLIENMSYPASKIAQFIYDDMKEFTSKELEADITSAVFKYRQKSQAVVEEVSNDDTSNEQQDENKLD